MTVEVVSPEPLSLAMERSERGYWRVSGQCIFPGSRYFYGIDGSIQRPDPASDFQPEGVHGPSQVVDHGSFVWSDGKWSGFPFEKLIFYELHIGTFTPAGTFSAAIEKLPILVDLGINALNLMPVAQFPGDRNWGYDGVFPYSVQNSYGGTEGLKSLVDFCHNLGIAVFVDVVYNHLGPEGNYLRDFGPYFTERYRTPWGDALNYDGPYSDEVRGFFIENARHWLRDYHVDGLRLDAVHAIFDCNAKHVLHQLAEDIEEYAEASGRNHYLVAESDLNDNRVIRARELGGHGIHAQWCDDFHHALHTLLTPERAGYYIDFGKTEHLVKGLCEGFVYSWQYSRFRKRHHGSSSKELAPHQFVVFSQNHDQVGNRMFGEWLTTLVPFEALKLAAGVSLLSPYVPLLFMGEEYGEESPFLYFVSHSDPELIRAVCEGRKKEFSAFQWRGPPPNPQEEETFLGSKLKWSHETGEKHRILFAFYKRLILLRKTHPAFELSSWRNMEVLSIEEKKIVSWHRWSMGSHLLCLMNFHGYIEKLEGILPAGPWEKVLDSSEEKWRGPGSTLPETIEAEAQVAIPPWSFVLLGRITPGSTTSSSGRPISVMRCSTAFSHA